MKDRLKVLIVIFALASAVWFEQKSKSIEKEKQIQIEKLQASRYAVEKAYQACMDSKRTIQNK